MVARGLREPSTCRDGAAVRSRAFPEGNRENRALTCHALVVVWPLLSVPVSVIGLAYNFPVIMVIFTVRRTPHGKST